MFGFFKKKQPEPVVAAIVEPNTEIRLDFSKRLQAVTNKIHSTDNLDELMLDMSQDICDLFHCERLTLYAVSKDKKFIFSKVKTGITTNQEIVLPIDPTSIAGYVAMSERIVRIKDAYDQQELHAYSQELQLREEVDRVTGYRTKQMLVAPILNPTTQSVIGVVQLLNNRDDVPFTRNTEEGLLELCKTIGVAFVQRMKAAARMRSKFESLVFDSVLSQSELDLACNWARRKNVDIEQALIEEFQVPIEALGKALSKSSNLPYEPYKANRRKPVEALKKFDRRLIDTTHTIPLEEDDRNLVLVTIEPELASQTHAIREIFPYKHLYFRITTRREFQQTVEEFLGTK